MYDRTLVLEILGQIDGALLEVRDRLRPIDVTGLTAASDSLRADNGHSFRPRCGRVWLSPPFADIHQFKT
jgi:hypothetical protein